MNSKTKKQHYVPQSYLRRFTSDGKQLYVFDKRSRTSFGPTNIANVAHENHFYDLADEAVLNAAQAVNIEPQSEKALAVLEGQFNKTIEIALKFAEGQSATPEDRMKMSLCAAIQLIRTKGFRDDLVKSMEAMGRAFGASALKLAKPELASQVEVDFKFKPDSISLLHGKFLWNPEFISQVAAALCNHIWIIGINKTVVPLFTSDNPVVRRAHKESPPLSPPEGGPPFEKAIDIGIESTRPGIETEGVELVFPLSPECVLIFLERTHFKELQERDGARLVLSEAHVQDLNRLQVQQSYRQVYSRSSDFSLAVALITADPTLSSRERDEFTIKTWERTKYN